MVTVTFSRPSRSHNSSATPLAPGFALLQQRRTGRGSRSRCSRTSPGMQRSSVCIACDCSEAYLGVASSTPMAT
eukprot:1524385-Prymnesium_polylepis.1